MKPNAHRRNVTDLDAGVVKGLAVNGATDAEMAAYLGVSVGGLRRQFKSILSQGRAARHVQIRQAQTKAAREGSVPMLTFLGKVELGQGDGPREDENRIIVRRRVDRTGKAEFEDAHPDPR